MPSNDTTEYKRTPFQEIFAIIVLELIAALIIYYIYSAFIIDKPYIYSDYGIFNLNASYTQMLLLETQFPFANLFAQISYHISKSLFSLLWNLMLISIQIFMPLSMFFFLKQLRFTLSSRTVASFFYLINPFSLSYGFGNEYSIYLLFTPIILTYIIKYLEDLKLIHLMEASLASFLLFSVNGLVQIRYLILIIVPLLLLIVINNMRGNLRKAVLDEVFAISFFVVISLPIIWVLFNNVIIFDQSYSHNSDVIANELGIVQYVFQSNSIFVSLLGITAYPGTLINSIGYVGTWSAYLYFFLILGSVVSALLYRGPYKSLYNTMLILLVALVSFQYLVYTGTLIFLYRFPFFDAFNYPTFFQLTQIVIYTIFIAQLIETIIRKTMHLKFRQKLVDRDNRFISILIVFSILCLVFFSSLPVITANNNNNTASVAVVTAPKYVNNLTLDLKNDQSSITLILPNNYTTLSYLDVSIPYNNVYGLPYNYQNFQSKFLNSSVFLNLSTDFQNNNIHEVKKILSAEKISTIVVLNPQINETIEASSISISGGGKNFANEINKTGIFRLAVVTNYFYIYYSKMPVSLSNSGITLSQVGTITYNITSISGAAIFLVYRKIKTIAR